MSRSMTKPTKWHVRIHPVWSVFAVRMKKSWVLRYPLSAQRRLWSDWADAQADLSLRWTHVILLVLSCCGSFIKSHTVCYLYFCSGFSFSSSRLFHLYWAKPLKLEGQNKKCQLKDTTWPSANTTGLSQMWSKWDYLSLVTRKPVFGVFNQVRLEPAYTGTEAS